jgi:enoyl-CoA hydratase/carnithine racemase
MTPGDKDDKETQATDAGEDSGSVRYEVSEGVATVTLDRPHRLNALTDSMVLATTDALLRADADDAVRVIVLTGAGRAFCAGADVSDPDSLSRPAPGSDRPPKVKPSCVDPRSLRKVVIAAVNGPAVGYGLTLALQCDIRYVAEDAKLGFVFVRRGIVAELGTHWLLPRLVGASNAAELLYTGRIFSGAEAVRIGLASGYYPAEKVLPTALTTARMIATEAAPLSVAVSKDLLWRSLDTDRASSERREAALLLWVQQQPDAVEGVQAYLDRRAPRWQGQAADFSPDRWLE